MADATTAARHRIDRALALLERKVNDLKAAPSALEDDMFALPPPPSLQPDEGRRIAELEAAGREAARALAAAAAAVREILKEEDTPEPDGAA